MTDKAEQSPKKEVVLLTDAECAKVMESADFYEKALEKLPEWWRNHTDYRRRYEVVHAGCEKARYLISRNMRHGRAKEYVDQARDYYETAHDRISDWVTDVLP